jgi:hypothetical protein
MWELVWTLLSAGPIAASSSSRGAVRGDIPDGRLVAAAAVAFAPTWHLLVNQQMTTIAGSSTSVT